MKEKKIVLKRIRKMQKSCKESEETVASDSTSTQEVVVLSNPNQLNKQTQNPSFKTKKGNFRDSDFEFDGIIVKVFWK
jgi:transcription termination factor Rho